MRALPALGPLEVGWRPIAYQHVRTLIANPLGVVGLNDDGASSECPTVGRGHRATAVRKVEAGSPAASPLSQVATDPGTGL